MTIYIALGYLADNTEFIGAFYTDEPAQRATEVWELQKIKENPGLDLINSEVFRAEVRS